MVSSSPNVTEKFGESKQTSTRWGITSSTSWEPSACSRCGELKSDEGWTPMFCDSSYNLGSGSGWSRRCLALSP